MSRRPRHVPGGMFAFAAPFVMLLAAGSAWAASFDATIEVVAARSSEISERVDEMEAEARPGAYLTNAEAISRFQDHLYLHLIGEHGPAAEGFFSLVTTGALTDSGLHRDAEWYLAEALLGLENYNSAAERFQLIVADEEHPFRDDAVRRLLELYAKASDKEAFRDLYDNEIVPGRVKPTALITYSLAKSFYQQDDLENAKGYFRAVEPGTEYYARARYFLGTVAVVENDLESAIRFFEEIAELPYASDEDRRVHDLALMALGRIHYHLQDYFQASEYYNQVAGDSAYQADKLYEVIWTSIRRERWRDALNNVEIFLLAFPDHEYTAQLQLLQGHLNFEEGNWTDALEAYEQVVADYAPVRDRFSSLALPGSQAEAEVREVIEDIEGAAGLPPYAIAMMRNDNILGRAMRVFQALEDERRDIEASERLIADLQAFLRSSGSMGSFEVLRLEAIEQRAEIVRQRMALLEAQGLWLESQYVETGLPPNVVQLEGRRRDLAARFAASEDQVVAGRTVLDDYERHVGALRTEAMGVRAEVDAADREREALETRLGLATPISDGERAQIESRLAELGAELDVARDRLRSIDDQISAIDVPDVLETVRPDVADAVFDEVSTLANDYAALRVEAPQPMVDRIEAAEALLADSYLRLGGVFSAIGEVEASEVGRLRERFEQEVDEVGRQRLDHQATLAAARGVSLKLTRDGFGRLEDFFSASVLKADTGIVDVFWAQKLEVADELQRVKAEKDQLVSDLEQRFRFIREKMGEAE